LRSPPTVSGSDVRLCHLGADGAAAQDKQPSGELLRAGGHPVVPRAGLTQARDRGNQRAGAGGQYHRPGRAEPSGGAVGGLDLDGPFPGQAAGTSDEVDSFALQPGLLSVVPPVRGHVIALRQGGRGVEVAGDRLRGSRRTPRRGKHVARPDERLGGNAAPVGALAADQLSFHDGNGEAAVGQAASDMFARRARADHHHVIWAIHLATLLRTAIVGYVAVAGEVSARANVLRPERGTGASRRNAGCRFDGDSFGAAPSGSWPGPVR
jgi:hypothetical protein